MGQDTTTLLYRRHVAHLSSALYPLLSVATGAPHPAFPGTLLHYHLLSEAQLDELAHFYHQRTPSVFSFSYPAPIIGRWSDADINDKRRRFGRFMGLRGCDSPLLRGETSEEQEMMDMWVELRIRANMDNERERNIWREKGF